VREVLAGSTDPRAAHAADLLAHVGTVDLAGIAELAATAIDVDDIRALEAIVAVEVLSPDEVRGRVQRIRVTQETVMAAADGDEDYRDGRAQLWRMRREMAELLAGYPDIACLPGVDEKPMGRYLVARSAARAMAIWMRNADTVEVRMLELTDALTALQAAARTAHAALDDRDSAWAPIAADLRRWLEHSREMRDMATRVQALAEAEAWIVGNGKALCAGRLDIVGPIGA
jgi:hypothetical protein